MGITVHKKYQVFVSSTFNDLIDERNEVMRALLELDCIPAGMEIFPSSDEDTWEYIKKVIDNCDYYVCIVAGKYGTIHESGVSYTELEYNYAQSQGIPSLAFIHADIASLAASRYELDPIRRKQLGDFTQRLKSKPCKFWLTGQQLGGLLSRSIIRLINEKPAMGWIRGHAALAMDRHETLLTKEKQESNGMSILVGKSNAQVFEVEVRRITYATTVKGAYAVVLMKRDSEHCLSIITGGVGAQGIAVELEEVKAATPRIHRMFMGFLVHTGFEIEHVRIWNIDEGIFQALIRWKDGNKVIEVKCLVSDALTLSLIAGAPIFVDSQIWDDYAIPPK